MYISDVHNQRAPVTEAPELLTPELLKPALLKSALLKEPAGVLPAARALLQQFLRARLSPAALSYYDTAIAKATTPLDAAGFNKLIALASRHARRQPLALSVKEVAQTAAELPGWNLADWNLLEALRVALILAQPNLHIADFAELFKNSFPFADEGELCAFYKAIPLLPEPQRFEWHMKEACRSNMRSLFCAAACNNPFPFVHFDEIAWQQLLMKAIFIEVPLAQVYGVQQRLSLKLAAMAQDFIAERRSAGRAIPADAEWLLTAGDSSGGDSEPYLTSS